ncbi:MAG TPA: hypothetical protein VE871_11230 [Longimicrobium sp.]|nr:hypothetical protein [Longimicrobium sp.]
MRRTLLLLASQLACIAAAQPAAAQPAAAQDTIRPGESVTGALAASDRVVDDGSHYDLWRFPVLARHRYRVTLRSDVFDAVVEVGPETGMGCLACRMDDDGGDGMNASLAYTVAEDGTYEIRAKSYDEEALGAYVLTLVDEGIHESHEPASTPIGAGETVQGELAPGDGRVRGRSFSDTYSYQGRAGETLLVTLTSDAFDTSVYFGRVNLRVCRSMDGDDDSGEGTNSRLVVRLNEDGEHHVHVASPVQGGLGAYTLRVERVGAELDGVDTVNTQSDLSRGSTVVSRLDGADPRLEDGSFYEEWTYRGEAGETLTLHMRSRDFDTYLSVGRIINGVWKELGHNDDGEAGTDSDLTVTLPADGEYVVRANVFGAGGSGRYSVVVDRS